MSKPTLPFEKAVQEIIAIAKLAEVNGFVTISRPEEKKRDNSMLSESLEVHSVEDAKLSLLDNMTHIAAMHWAMIQFMCGIHIICTQTDKEDGEIFSILMEQFQQHIDECQEQMSGQWFTLDPKFIKRITDFSKALSQS